MAGDYSLRFELRASRTISTKHGMQYLTPASLRLAWRESKSIVFLLEASVDGHCCRSKGSLGRIEDRYRALGTLRRSHALRTCRRSPTIADVPTRATDHECAELCVGECAELEKTRELCP
jgi:hypothetical protein